MLIRVKRKRNEDPLDSLLVEETEQRTAKKRGDGAGVGSLTGAMQSLTTGEQDRQGGAKAMLKGESMRYSFKRIGSLSVGENKKAETKKLVEEIRRRRKTSESKTDVEAKAKTKHRLAHSTRLRRARYTRQNRARNLAAEGGGEGQAAKEVFCLLDLDASSLKRKADTTAAAEIDDSSDAACDSPRKSAKPPPPPGSAQSTPVSKKRTPSRILTPVQREMDKAVWHAFRTADFRNIFALLSQGADVNFQRIESDGTFALLAAAFHCCAIHLPVPATSVVKSLLGMKANPTLKDATGMTALQLAQRQQAALRLKMKERVRVRAGAGAAAGAQVQDQDQEMEQGQRQEQDTKQGGATAQAAQATQAAAAEPAEPAEPAESRAEAEAEAEAWREADTCASSVVGMLRRAAEAMDEQAGDFVWDVYYLEHAQAQAAGAGAGAAAGAEAEAEAEAGVDAPKGTTGGAAATGSASSDTSGAFMAVQSLYGMMEAQGGGKGSGQVHALDEDGVEALIFASDDDDDDDHASRGDRLCWGGEDEDSNDENHAFNDYPDEESGSEGSEGGFGQDSDVVGEEEEEEEDSDSGGEGGFRLDHGGGYGFGGRERGRLRFGVGDGSGIKGGAPGAGGSTYSTSMALDSSDEEQFADEDEDEDEDFGD